MAFRKLNLETSVSTTHTLFDDSLIVLGRGATTNDIGFLGKRAANTYTGLIRDNDTGKFVLIDSYTSSDITNNDIDVVNSVLQKGDLDLRSIVVDTIEADTLTVSTLNVTTYSPASIESDSIVATTTMIAPKGTTAQRPSNPVEGQIWFNTDNKMFEGYDGTTWQVLIPSQLGTYQ